MATRILVADDQDLVRAGYTTILSSQPGITIVGQATDGVEAVELARRLRPDLVIMDIRMPLLDGIEATRRLAGPDAGPDGPRVLVVTTFNLDRYVFEAIRAGASGFLLKDTPAETMIDGVRTVAAGHALLAPEVTRNLIGHFGARLRRDDAGLADVLAALTGRETDVLRLIAAGLSNPEIAAALFISRETVKSHVSRILIKLNLRDRVHAVVLAHRIGLTADPREGGP